MTTTLAQFLAGLTIVAAGALLASVLVSLLPARRRSFWTALAIGGVAVTSVAFGTEIGQGLPDRIVATHRANDTLASVREALPELAQLEEADPLTEYELRSTFHTAFLAESGSVQDRAERAGRAMGLAIQRAHLRHLSGLPDLSARRIIAIERQILEEQARADPMGCNPSRSATADRQSAANSARLLELRRAELHAKLAAVVDRGENLPAFDIVERRQFEIGLRDLAAHNRERQAPGEASRCRALLNLYTALEQQPLRLQGMWVRSRRFYSGRS